MSISRNNFSWGIKIPCDDNGKQLLDNNGNWIDGLQDSEKHIIYVWLDALFNYQSAIQNNLETFWKNADVVHIIGKDIIKFHTIYWLAFLIALQYKRDELKTLTVEKINNDKALPTTVFAHGWWTNEGKKISKSFGNVINPFEEIDWLQNTFNIDKNIAIDYFRYYLSTDGVFGNDLDYSRTRLVDKINSELVNNIGNLVQRVLSMIYKNCEGKIEKVDFDNLSKLDKENLNSINNIETILQKESLNIFDFCQYRDLILSIANNANDYMEKTAPWTLKKEGRTDEMKKVLNLQVYLFKQILILLQPICPYISKQALDFLNIDNRLFSDIKDNRDLQIDAPKGFFPRLAVNQK